MKRADITFLVGSVFLACASVFYCATIWFSVQVPRYYPLEHAWKWVKEEGVPSQAWYGMQTAAFLAAGMVSLCVYAALRRASSRPPLSPATTRRVALLSVLVVVVCMIYLLCYEYQRWGVFGSARTSAAGGSRPQLAAGSDSRSALAPGPGPTLVNPWL